MFRLVKWYSDCVSEEGVAFVGYWARMRWGPFTVPYAATLYKPVRDATRERYSLLPCVAPNLQEGELRWDCRRLGIQGVWNSRLPAIHRTLLDTTEGSIEWHCHLPSAGSRIDLAGVGQVSGTGYAERLAMSVKPWRLPFDNLRWGRFLSPDDSVTWIEWSGEESRRWVFHNGVELRGATIKTDRVELPGGHGVLELRDAAVIREGFVASTALGAIPAARTWLPGGIRKAHETKWLSRGTLTASGRCGSGWAIHEVVKLR